MYDHYASQFWPLSCVFVLWETQLLSRSVIRRIRRLALNASYMKESHVWTLDLKVMTTAFWSKGITFLKDTEYAILPKVLKKRYGLLNKMAAMIFIL